MKIHFLSALWLLLFSIAGLADTLDESELAGLWQGTAEVESGPMRFDIELSFDGEALGGVFVLISEGGMRLPVEQVEVDGQTIRLVAMEGTVTVAGTVDGDEIIGHLQTPTGELSMQLARSGSAAAEAMIVEIDQARAQASDALRSEPLELVRSGPGMDRMDADALDELLAAAEAGFSTALALMHDGDLVGEWYRGDGPALIETMSVTKVALNLLVGRLITLGVLDSVDTPVHHFYPQWADDETRSSITIRHLLAHTSGLDRGQPAGPIYQSGDFVGFALEAPLEAEPGTQVIYSKNATNLLGGIIGELLDQPLETFLAEDLFGLMGIEEFAWHPDPAGNPQGMAGLQLTAGDLALLGQLALDSGRWQDQQLIDADWFKQSFVPGSEHSDGVGLIWFLTRDNDRVVGAFHGGYLGQYLGIRFDERIVGVRLIANSPAYNPETDRFRNFAQYLSKLLRVD